MGKKDTFVRRIHELSVMLLEYAALLLALIWPVYNFFPGTELTIPFSEPETL